MVPAGDEEENIKVQRGRRTDASLKRWRPPGPWFSCRAGDGLKHYLGPFRRLCQGRNPAADAGSRRQPRLDIQLLHAQEDEVYTASSARRLHLERPPPAYDYRQGHRQCDEHGLYHSPPNASISRRRAADFKFPGSTAQWNGLSDMTERAILGKQLIWASTHDFAKNNAYNIVNGDLFRWNWMWPRIAKWFGVESEGLHRRGDAARHPNGRRRGRMEAHRGKSTDSSKPDLARVGLALAHRSRSQPAHRGDDRHGREPETGFTAYQNTEEAFHDLFASCARTGSFHDLKPLPTRPLRARPLPCVAIAMDGAGRRSDSTRSASRPNPRQGPETAESPDGVGPKAIG